MRGHVLAVNAVLCMWASGACAQETIPVDPPGEPVDTAPAAREDGPRLGEVVVTARRREEALQESPVAVTAISAEELAQTGVSSIADLQQHVPSLTFGESGSKTTAIFIRGIGQREASVVLDPGVGVYLNGVYIARQDTQLLDTVDTESVQVLRGPQGTLFGKNSTGGAVLFTTRAPDPNEFSLSATAKIGDFGRRNAKVFANVPLVEGRIGTRIGFNVSRFEGDLRNFDGKRFNDEDRWAASLRSTWNVSENFSADLFGFLSHQDERSMGFTCILQNTQSNIAQLHYPGLPAFADSCNESERLARDHRISLNSADSFTKISSSILALTLTWNVGDDDEIKSITGWSHQWGIERNDDQDGTSSPIIDSGGTGALDEVLAANGLPKNDEKRDQVSQELQWVGATFEDRLSYTFGVFGSLETMDDNPFTQMIGPKGLAGVDPSTVTDAVIPGLPDLGGAAVLPIVTFLGTRSDLENKSWAVFSQFTWSFTDHVQLTGGVRYTHEARERKLTLFDVDELEYGTRIGAVYLEPLGFYSPLLRTQFDALADDLPDLPIDVLKNADVRKKSWNTVTPAATLAVKANDEWLQRLHLDSGLLYATYSEGFTAGGFEPRGPELVPFEPEELKNYEIGMKLDTLDSHLRFNAALYYMDYTNIQVRVAEQGARISDLFLFLSNAAKATVKGAELETTVLLGDAVFSASMTYTDAQYGDYLTTIVVPGQGQSTADRSSEPFFMVPEFSWTLGVQYNLLTPVGMFIPRVGMYSRSEVFTGYDYLAADYASSTLDNLTLFNARLSWIPSERFRVTAFVDNLSNEKYFRSGFSLSALLGSATLVQGQERTMGVELTYEFY